MKKIILIFVLLIFIPFTYAYWGECIWGIGTWGSDDCQPAQSPPSGGGGGGGSITVPSTFTQVDLFGAQPSSINGNLSCNIGYQLLDGRCYACDPSIGYLEFNPADRSVLCMECGKGYYYNGTGCVQTINIEKSKLPLVILVVSLGMVSYYFILEKNKRKKPSEEQESQEEETDGDS